MMALGALGEVADLNIGKHREGDGAYGICGSESAAAQYFSAKFTVTSNEIGGQNRISDLDRIPRDEIRFNIIISSGHLEVENMS